MLVLYISIIFEQCTGVFVAEPLVCLITFHVASIPSIFVADKRRGLLSNQMAFFENWKSESPLTIFLSYFVLAYVFGSTSQFLFHKCFLQTVYLSIVGYWKGYQKTKCKICPWVFQKVASPLPHLNYSQCFAFFINIS